MEPGSTTPTAAPEIPEAEILHRLQGHLKPFVADDLPVEPRRLRLGTGIFFLLLHLGLLALIWAVFVWFPLWIVALLLGGLVADFLRLFWEWGMWTEFGRAIYNQLVLITYTVLMVGTYAWALRGTLRAAHRAAADPFRQGDDYVGVGGGCSSYRNFLHLLWRILLLAPTYALTCLLPGGREAPGADPLTAVTRLCFLLAQVPQPVSLEKAWNLLRTRFPDTFPDESAGKAFLARHLRELAEAQILTEQRFDAVSAMPATLYAPAPKLRDLLRICRRVPGRDDPARPIDPADPTDRMSVTPPGRDGGPGETPVSRSAKGPPSPATEPGSQGSGDEPAERGTD
ncbi:MAG: hypothetical protein GX442_24975 [Candidatus Riflebacteria bacterium]|nr:hypothetical protein [Candidatus Riflebacteria bacterium]